MIFIFEFVFFSLQTGQCIFLLSNGTYAVDSNVIFHKQESHFKRCLNTGFTSMLLSKEFNFSTFDLVRYL